MINVQITITLALPDEVGHNETMFTALHDLADIMTDQAQDGLYVGGHADADDARHLADFTTIRRTVLIGS